MTIILFVPPPLGRLQETCVPLGVLVRRKGGKKKKKEGEKPTYHWGYSVSL